MIIPFFLRLETFRLFLFSMEISHQKTIEKITLWKINIKPENYPIEKANHPANLHFRVQHVVFSWVYLSFPQLPTSRDIFPGQSCGFLSGIPSHWCPFPIDGTHTTYLLGIGIREVYYMAGGFFFGEFIVFGVRCRCFHFPQTSQLLRRIQAHCAKLQLYSHVHLLHFPCKNSKRTS